MEAAEHDSRRGLQDLRSRIDVANLAHGKRRGSSRVETLVDNRASGSSTFDQGVSVHHRRQLYYGAANQAQRQYGEDRHRDRHTRGGTWQRTESSVAFHRLT